MMIGSFSQIPYCQFAAALAPVAALGLILTVIVIAVVYRREFLEEKPLPLDYRVPHLNRILLWKSLTVSLGMVFFFFAGLPVSKVAVIAGALLLVTRRVKPEKIYQQIDWGLLVLFIGLFIVIAGLEKTGVAADLFSAASRFHLERTVPLSVFTALLSNLVGNVPAVLVFKSFVPRLPDPAHG
jgi:Na+/H+ antiporter NhaD/arsenite permease-like protein